MIRVVNLKYQSAKIRFFDEMRRNGVELEWIGTIF